MSKILGMTPDEAYASYLAFCEENGFKDIWSKEKFIKFNEQLKKELSYEGV